jgi:hypothetical protein
MVETSYDSISKARKKPKAAEGMTKSESSDCSCFTARQSRERAGSTVL